MWSYAAEVFWAVLHQKSFLELKARSRAPGFAYIHAPPAPYKGTHATVVTCAVGIYRVHTKATRKRVMSKRKVSTSKRRSNLPVQRWRYCCRMLMCPFYSTMAIF